MADAVTVEEVAILYERPSQPSGEAGAGDFDLIKWAKFLDGLSKTVSCKLFTTDEFCDEEQTTTSTATAASPKKWSKAVIFVRNADTMKETVEKVRKRFDAEKAVEVKVVVTATEKTKLDAPGVDVIRSESLEEVADWYPQILVFLFEREQRRDRLAVFMIDHEMNVEVEWYEKVKEVCARFDKTCIWTGSLADTTLTLGEQTVDTVVVVSRGKGDEVLPKHNNDVYLLALATVKKIKFLVFTDNTGGKAVRAAKAYRDLAKTADPTIYKCTNSLEMDYIKWTSLMQKMGIVDCIDVTEPSKVMQVLMIIGIVLYVIFILFPFFFIILFLAVCCGVLIIPGCIPIPFANKIRPGGKVAIMADDQPN